jgi:hypothetical protein
VRQHRQRLQPRQRHRKRRVRPEEIPRRPRVPLRHPRRRLGSRLRRLRKRRSFFTAFIGSCRHHFGRGSLIFGARGILPARLFSTACIRTRAYTHSTRFRLAAEFPGACHRMPGHRTVRSSMRRIVPGSGAVAPCPGANFRHFILAHENGSQQKRG